jgi:hypothetical protein
MDQKFLGLLDMLDGGGAGRSGQTFEGGPLSGFLNSLGVRPMGYMDRLEQARPMRRPMQRPMQPAAPSAAPDVAGMSTEELVKLIEAALGRAPRNSVMLPTMADYTAGRPSVEAYAPPRY